MTNKTVLNSAETAKILNVSLRTVQLWAEKGVLSAWKTPGGHRRITLESIQELQHKQSVQAGITKTKSVLQIVEDNEQLRKLYRKNLACWDIPLELHIAEDGYQGLMMFGEIKPDLLITDLMMPSMSGEQMIKSILNNNDFSEEQIIVVTAKDMESPEVIKLQELNVKVLQKPINFHQLKELIQEKVSAT